MIHPYRFGIGYGDKFTVQIFHVYSDEPEDTYEPPPPDLQASFNQGGPQLPPREVKPTHQKRGSGPILPPSGPMLLHRRPVRDTKDEAPPLPPAPDALRPMYPTPSKDRTPSPGRPLATPKKNYVDVKVKQPPPTTRPPVSESDLTQLYIYHMQSCYYAHV